MDLRPPGGFQSLRPGAPTQHFWVYRTFFIRLNRCYTISTHIITSTAHVSRQSSVSATVAAGQPHVASTGEIYSSHEILELSPVTLKDSATYSC
ncbi:hypothetical protein DAPPUDRAFT_258581 [Daphnia pulex]|uniref:Uncharacterized protein n=1 Tax=Daphnia pulex TaxID=6669 RepID=E9HFM9_DAPPU|nr:hypothetical protein DAPPUDRAFT_258581 [Daphnia pulex]|eukprot:EFX69475.1 hypothetical protein DAPPUDRAFT_258581 [Daphnia pulex]